jgi:hypothetical protein
MVVSGVVRCVGGELPDLVLGPQPGAERLLNPVQHGVDGGAEPADLGDVIRVGHPRGQVALGGDPLGGAGHLAQRRQPAADEPAPAQRQEQDQRAPGDQLGDHDAADLTGDDAHRAGDDEHRQEPPPAGRPRAGSPDRAGHRP